MNRRTALRLGAAAATAGLAGCAAVGADPPPDVSTHTGLAQDTSHALADERVALAGDPATLPAPPRTVDSLDAATLAMATPDAQTAPLADALREGTAVAITGDGAPAAFRSLLAAVGDAYHWGLESVDARPVGPLVAVPRGDALDTVWTVREGGWADPVLDPLGWALEGRLPDCRTFVPSHTVDDRYASLGTATVAGRLPTGETYAARTRGQRYAGDAAVRRHRFRTTLHAAAGDGAPVASARRVADFPNDASLADLFPNPHEGDGIRVSNRSGPVDERLEVAFEPTTDRRRAALTGCCGATVDDAVAYDHRTRVVWTRDGLFGSTSRYGGGTGRGTWHVRR